jgi:tetratricopeptide (TPR) repeat protein
MKQTIITAIVALAAGTNCLLAQQGKAQAQQGAAPAAQAGPKVKSPKEAQAVMALGQAQSQGPDATIKAAEELVTNFADTEFKEIALTMEASAYQQKGDYAKAEIMFERVLDVNPKSAEALRELGEITVVHTKENDLDKEDKLTKAEKQLNQAMDLIKVAPKPNPQMTDEQWAENKKFIIAQAQNDLGLSALLRNKYDQAISLFKTAIESDPQPAYQVRLASAYQKAGKNDDAIAICDKLMGDAQLHPTIRQFAQAVRAAAVTAKGQAKP